VRWSGCWCGCGYWRRMDCRNEIARRLGINPPPLGPAGCERIAAPLSASAGRLTHRSVRASGACMRSSPACPTRAQTAFCFDMPISPFSRTTCGRSVARGRSRGASTVPALGRRPPRGRGDLESALPVPARPLRLPRARVHTGDCRREKGSAEAAVRYLKTGFLPARRFQTLGELDGLYADGAMTSTTGAGTRAVASLSRPGSRRSGRRCGRCRPCASTEPPWVSGRPPHDTLLPRPASAPP
jgi:hypothetical protein